MPNELYHHGINGQRWGFRRFQNEDGSLTPEGELRYNQGKQKAARGKAAEMYKTKKYKAKLALKQEKQKVKDAAKLAKTAKKEQAKVNAEDRVIKKKAKNMTDEELRNEVNRLAMELDYQKKSWQLEKSKKGPTMLDKADSFFETTTGRLVGQLGSSIIQNVAQTQLNNVIAAKIDPQRIADIKNKKVQMENNKKIGEGYDLDNAAKRQKMENEQKVFNAEYEKTYGNNTKTNTSQTSTTKTSPFSSPTSTPKESPQPQPKSTPKPKSQFQYQWDNTDWSKAGGDNLTVQQNKNVKVSSLDSAGDKYWAKVTTKSIPQTYLDIVVNGKDNPNNTNSVTSNYFAKATGLKHEDEDEEEVVS